MKRNHMIYQISLRAFTPEGTLKGAEKMLPHIASLGFDIVYLCPFFEMDADEDPRFLSPRQIKSGIPLFKNPYRIRDYFNVDKEHGTGDDLHSFVTAAHSLGLLVMLDLVYFHCGPTAVFAEEHPDFIVRNEDSSIACGRWNFPQLNFQSPGLREYLWSNMEYFIREYDVDGYRCDVAERVPLDFWAEGKKRICAIKPDAILLDEGYGPEFQHVFDMYYNIHWCYPLRDVFREHLSAAEFVASAQAETELMPDCAVPICFIDNHDTVKNRLREGRFEAVVGHDRMEAALVIIYTSYGIPFIYNGNEICDEQEHTLYANRFVEPNLRINWSSALTLPAARRMHMLRTLAQLRRNNAVLTEGSTHYLTVGDPDRIIAYTREKDGRTVTVIVNTAESTLQSSAHFALAPHARVLLQKDFVIHSQDEHVHFAANPGGYIVIEQ